MQQQRPIGKEPTHNHSNNSSGQFNSANFQHASSGRGTTQTFSQGHPLGTLSAQNLMFLPANPGQFPMMVQQINAPRAWVQKNDEESRLKFQKDRQLEQQRHKLQQAFAQVATSGGRQDAQSQRDAMIAQIIGPLPPGARHPETGTVQTPVSINVHETLTQPNQHSLSSHSKKINPNPSKVSSSSVQLAPHDLERMMQRCYDLSNDQKAQGFVKSTLNNMAPTSVSNQVYMPDPNAANWNFNNTTNLEGVFVLPSSMPVSSSANSFYPLFPGAYPVWKPFPPWLQDSSKIPKDYLKLLHNCIPPNRFEEIPDTGLVYILLRASGLSNEVLGAVWAMVNRTQPGQLTKIEFFAAMALVAFAQQNNKVPTLDALENMTVPLIPSFIKMDPIVQPQQLQASVGSAQTNVVQPIQPASNSAFCSSKKEDEFNEFTDFQTANLNPQPVSNNFDETLDPKVVEEQHHSNNVVNDNGDPYAALRELYPSKSTNFDPTEAHSSSITTSISDNTFVFHNSNELGATHKLDHIQKEFNEKNVSDQDNWSKIQASNLHQSNSQISRDPSLSLAAFNDLENDNLTKFAFGQTSFDSPDSCSLQSKEPSLHSLDLKSVLTIDSNEDNKETDTDLIGQHLPKDNGHINNGTVLSTSANLYDRYSAVRHPVVSPCEEKHIEAWTRILEVSFRLLQESCDHFSKASTTASCKEVVNSERGSVYLKSLIEVYRIARRVEVSLKMNALQNDRLTNMLSEIEVVWETLCNFLGFSELIPKQNEMHFNGTMLKPESNDEHHEDACGICLLNVNVIEKTNCGHEFSSKIISYSGRQYHSQCANLWINCVEPILPSLRVQNLL